MRSIVHIPNSLRSAGREIRLVVQLPLERLPRDRFVRVWSTLFYLFPRLHPDGYENSESGWPRVLKRFAAEALRRSEAGELADEELYPSDAQWSGLYDRMFPHTDEEMDRRFVLAAHHGETLND